MLLTSIFPGQTEICNTLKQNGYESVETVYSVLVQSPEQYRRIQSALGMKKGEFWRFCRQLRRTLGKDKAQEIRAFKMPDQPMGCLSEKQLPNAD